MENKTTLIIIPKSDSGDTIYSLLNLDTGEGLAQHWCSHGGFAPGDLYFNVPERVKEYQERFGEIEVKFIDETEITIEELLELNRGFHEDINRHRSLS